MRNPVTGEIEHRRMLLSVPMDEPLLHQIAEHTGGTFYKATNGEALERIFKEIDRLEKTPLKVNRYVRYREAYPSLAWAGLGFLLLPFAAAGVRMTAEP
jgi:Ca-activated chloride channel family protein